jgi:hypothetical protein
MTEQAIVDLFAKAAKPRLMELLKLKVTHVYENHSGQCLLQLVIDLAIQTASTHARSHCDRKRARLDVESGA